MKLHMLTAIGGTPTIAAGTVIERDKDVAVEWFLRGYAEPCDDEGRKAYAAAQKKTTAAQAKADKDAAAADTKAAEELAKQEAENRPTRARRRSKEGREATTADPVADQATESTED